MKKEGQTYKFALIRKLLQNSYLIVKIFERLLNITTKKNIKL